MPTTLPRVERRQATLFCRSLAPVDQNHLVVASTFELGKIYEQTIKNSSCWRWPTADADLCQKVATGGGLPVPVATVADPGGATTAAISQLGRPGRSCRMVGFVSGPPAMQLSSKPYAARW